MSAHADETDDFEPVTKAHPGCAVVPAALAMAEREGRSGTELLRAVVLGYDLCCRFLMALGPDHVRGTHRSAEGTSATFGAVGAAASLARLNEVQMRYAISYAAQQVSGLWSWVRDNEHIEKAFDFGGMPARNGVTAAIMVAMKFTGVEDALSGDRGFFHAFGATAEPGRLIVGLGREFEIMNTAIKRWPVGSPIQAPLDALLLLIKEQGVSADNVEKVVVRVAHQGANTTDNRHMPDICMQHMCAVMLLYGTVSFKSAHDEKRMRHPKVQEMRKKIELLGDDALTRAMPSRQGIVEVELRDGRTLRHHTTAVRGTAENPMSRAEVDAKSYDLIAPVIGKARARRLCNEIWQLEKLSNLRKLRPLLMEKP